MKFIRSAMAKVENWLRPAPKTNPLDDAISETLKKCFQKNSGNKN